MSVTPALAVSYMPAAQGIANIEEMAQLGSQAVFRARPVAMSSNILSQMERRDRIVLLLLDGDRTLQEVARLIHRNEVEVAYVLVRLLKRNFIEFLGAPRKKRSTL